MNHIKGSGEQPALSIRGGTAISSHIDLSIGAQGVCGAGSVGCGEQTALSGSVANSILTEAADIVGGARNTTHGDKERSFEAIAGLWNSYLSARKEGFNSPITATDVAWLMVLLKCGRSVQGKPVRDHFVDAAGYAAIAGELQA